MYQYSSSHTSAFGWLLDFFTPLYSPIARSFLRYVMLVIFLGGTGQSHGIRCSGGSYSTAAVARMMPDCTCKWVAYGIPAERPCLSVGVRLSKRAWTDINNGRALVSSAVHCACLGSHCSTVC